MSSLLSIEDLEAACRGVEHEPAVVVSTDGFDAGQLKVALNVVDRRPGPLTRDPGQCVACRGDQSHSGQPNDDDELDECHTFLISHGYILSSFCKCTNAKTPFQLRVS